jgi:hypothetical protein
MGWLAEGVEWAMMINRKQRCCNMLNQNGMGMITKYQNVKLPGYPGNLGMERFGDCG